MPSYHVCKIFPVPLALLLKLNSSSCRVVTYRAGDAEFLGRLKKYVETNELMQCDFRVLAGRICTTRYSHKKFGCKYSHNRFLPNHRHIQKENAKMLSKELGHEDVRHITWSNVRMILGFHCRMST